MTKANQTSRPVVGRLEASVSPQAWGHGQFVVIAAFRYCLGRQTYIVGECTDWLVQIWPHLIESAREIIRRDVEEAFERDDLQRADGLTYKALGDDCDRERWERVRRLWDAEAR